uniref:Uncharacterized protein n=1 Tax=Amphimedon queenslandica TaxID=400682 RepID=A0A1X7UP75_AMPQE
MVELEKIQSSLKSVENWIKALEGQSPPTKHSHSERVTLGSDDPALPWANRCPSPQGDFAPGSWEEEMEFSNSSNLKPPVSKLSESSKTAVALSFSKLLSNEERRKMRNLFDAPDLTETECTRLDSL